MTNKTEKTKTVNHPMEQLFDVEPETTIVYYEETEVERPVDHVEYDDKDNEIETQLQTIYTKAMDAFDIQIEETELVEGKYKARNAEVAVQYLNAALNAVKEKSTMKAGKDKLAVAKQAAGTAKTVNNNLIVDRNELLKLMSESKQ